MMTTSCQKKGKKAKLPKQVQQGKYSPPYINWGGGLRKQTVQTFKLKAE